ncbi:MAG: flagellar basal body-associated FliL family protein [Planctomycetota bacterium]|jgi:flagellar basal body-associated protein FliL
MAEETEKTENTENTEATDQTGEGGEKFKGLFLPAIGVLLAIFAIAAGFGLGGLFGGPGEAQAVTEDQVETALLEDVQTKDSGADFEYFEFETITGNLNEPQMARYIRATVALAIRKDEDKEYAKTLDLLEQNRLELRHQLSGFLHGLSIEDVRGTQKRNRVQREILDMLNEQLWPKGRPRIDHVLFKEFAVQ